MITVLDGREKARGFERAAARNRLWFARRALLGDVESECDRWPPKRNAMRNSKRK